MATWYGIEIGKSLAPTSDGGIGGAPIYAASTTLGGRVRALVSSYRTSGNEQINDTLVMGYLSPMDRLFFGSLSWDSLGVDTELSVGKLDINNAANTDTQHFLDATSSWAAGMALCDKNVGEQVGANQAGDQSTGQTTPGYGASPIIVTVTFANAAPAAGQSIYLRILYLAGGN